ncbi:hypothetical protein DRO58_00730 [Candidatus Bathyarchaeota archaeon]|nr:MAG: hypothetical protein DRO58_00730 [Candidatus Bathyarchaeota archaeon]
MAVMMRFPKKFVERCQRFAEEHPDLARDANELVERCGRLGMRFFSKLYGGDERLPDSGRRKRRRKFEERLMEGENWVPLYLPDEDVKTIREVFVEKYQITSTATAFYMLCTYMVLLGYWELPIKI